MLFSTSCHSNLSFSNSIYLNSMYSNSSMLNLFKKLRNFNLNKCVELNH